MNASEMYAITQGYKCEGPWECHWCTAHCKSDFTHDDPVIPFKRITSGAKRPGNSYVCKGCSYYKTRGKQTVMLLGGGYVDRKYMRDFSWLMTLEGIWAITPQDHQTLWKLLLSPPHDFCLTLIENIPTGHIHLSLMNSHSEIKADTPLHFTFDNILHSYTVYELEECLKVRDPSGAQPGVHALMRFLSPYEPPIPEEPEEKRGKGRPPKQEDRRKRTV